ncbi:hypothetical protein CSA_000012 [Cucumis sativus]|uniref:Uncharacterized protein n=1 Tax=Cucumis sativus TaxID=3659 RepID=A0ACB6HBX6_CUCSA|nr:hypothetical protein CSA_000012 [Cucumis sativus]
MHNCWMLHGSYLNDERRQNYWDGATGGDTALGRGYRWGHGVADLDNGTERHGVTGGWARRF